MPLGKLTKQEVRQIAEQAGLPVAHKKDSQEICFVTDGHYADFIEEHAQQELPPKGEFLNRFGEIVGQHQGIYRYTVGQRKGIGVYGPEPHYVIRLDACHNRVVMGTREEAFVREFDVEDTKWMSLAPTKEMISAFVKIRSTGIPLGPVEFEGGVCRAPGEGLFGAAPGQSAVFYRGQVCLGGAIIDEKP